MGDGGGDVFPIRGWLWLVGDGADGDPRKTGVKSGGSKTAPPQKPEVKE